ncbi:MAG: cell division protein ZapE [Gammaproteobacteria bacterium]|nr:cell division protein ZapE [Gammaproteobacteria bacterium]MDH5777606.1 cell division protein ZapE [Gammaproteobacteria bacterium]
MTPIQHYQQLLHHGYQADPIQEQAMLVFDDLYLNLISEDWPPGLFTRMLSKVKPVTGIYLHGGTGRGKTWLMDSFYACADFPEKHRLHFHRFMRDVHYQLSQLEHINDPLKVVAKKWAERYRMICLDEFHVSDIADAMILGGLLDALFKEGVTLVTTSNIAIEDLYKNGLQRERFLPAIDLLKRYTQELSLDGDKDYRIGLIEQDDIFHVLQNGEGNAVLKKQFNRLANVPPKSNREIEINQREFHYQAWANELIWFSFDELCSKPRSANDYLDIAKSFHTIFISDIPELDEAKDDAAKRFIHLIDALYDNHVKLIATTAAPVDQLYHGRLVKFEFDRTISRLTEMASQDYLHKQHLSSE